jgi:hypothetical protein
VLPARAKDEVLLTATAQNLRHGPKAETVVARYQCGLFLPVPGVGSLEKMAQNQKDDELFLTMLDQFERQGRPVSDKPNANNYAPALFSKDLRANGTSKTRLADAMNRANKIRVASYGPPSRTWTKLTPS